MILVFDTETSGLPDFKWNWETDYSKYPDIVQIAWQIYDDAGNLQYEASHLIKPDGWTIPKEAQAIHGITTKFATENGHDLKTVLRHFIMDAHKAGTIVAHNIHFDTSMVKTALLKLGISKSKFNDQLDKEKRFDTMMEGYKLTNGTHIGTKWPKLIELYKFLFDGDEFSNAHDALGDVKACADCYFKLINK